MSLVRLIELSQRDAAPEASHPPAIGGAVVLQLQPLDKLGAKQRVIEFLVGLRHEGFEVPEHHEAGVPESACDLLHEFERHALVLAGADEQEVELVAALL